MNDPIIHAKASAIVEAIEKQQPTYRWRDRYLYSISAIRTALASLGGEGFPKKSPEDILTEIANTNSYESWGELMYDSHDQFQVEYTIDAMIEYASQFTHQSEREVLEGKLVKLGELDAGKLFRYNETIALKSEYITEKGAVEAFIVGSGEMFWGGTTIPEDQVELEVIELITPKDAFYCLEDKNIHSLNTTPFSRKFPKHKDDDMYLIFWADDSPPDIAHLYEDTGLNGVLMRINGTNAIVNVDLRIMQRKLAYGINKIIDGFEMRKILIRFVDYYNARYSQEILSHSEIEEYLMDNKYNGGLV